MAISLASIKRGVSETPPRILIYGVQGIGKSTFGASAPAPIFLPTEDGLGVIDAPSFPLARFLPGYHGGPQFPHHRGS